MPVGSLSVGSEWLLAEHTPKIQARSTRAGQFKALNEGLPTPEEPSTLNPKPLNPKPYYLQHEVMLSTPSLSALSSSV